MQQILIQAVAVFNRGTDPTERTDRGSTQSCVLLVTLDDADKVVDTEIVQRGMVQPDYIPSEVG